jgi:hypothetical protein
MRQVGSAARAGVIGMCVREDGFVHRFPGIDVNARLPAEYAAACKLKKHLFAIETNGPKVTERGEQTIPEVVYFFSRFGG